jgi:hypothetical protein
MVPVWHTGVLMAAAAAARIATAAAAAAAQGAALLFGWRYASRKQLRLFSHMSLAAWSFLAVFGF